MKSIVDMLTYSLDITTKLNITIHKMILFPYLPFFLLSSKRNLYCIFSTPLSPSCEEGTEKGACFWKNK